MTAAFGVDGCARNDGKERALATLGMTAKRWQAQANHLQRYIKFFQHTKYYQKNASHRSFTLLFFHGASKKEIANLRCIPAAKILLLSGTASLKKSGESDFSSPDFPAWLFTVQRRFSACSFFSWR
jgi:hypothetical protein